MSLLVAATAASLSVAAVSPAAASEPPEVGCDASVELNCGDPIAPLPPSPPSASQTLCEATYLFMWVARDRGMSSCFTSFYGWGPNYEVETVVMSESFWGYHGCVKIHFLNSANNVVYSGYEQRWGVNGNDSRTISWTGLMPSGFQTTWNHAAFEHYRC